MAKFIACYDPRETNPKPHSEFLKAAAEHVWVPWILSSSDRWYHLPNTTLIGEFSGKDADVEAFKAIRPAAEKELGIKITVEKWIVAEYVRASFNPA